MKALKLLEFVIVCRILDKTKKTRSYFSLRTHYVRLNWASGGCIWLDTEPPRGGEGMQSRAKEESKN